MDPSIFLSFTNVGEGASNAPSFTIQVGYFKENCTIQYLIVLNEQIYHAAVLVEKNMKYVVPFIFFPVPSKL